MGRERPRVAGASDDHPAPALDTSANECVVQDEYDYGADYGYQNAVEVDAGHSGHSELLKKKSTNHRPDNAEDDIEQHAFAGLVDDLAADESRDQS